MCVVWVSEFTDEGEQGQRAERKNPTRNVEQSHESIRKLARMSLRIIQMLSNYIVLILVISHDATKVQN